MSGEPQTSSIHPCVPHFSRSRGSTHLGISQLPRNFCPRLGKAGRKDLAGLAVSEFEAQRGGALPESAKDAGPLLEVVGVGSGIAVHQRAFQSAIHQDGELARGRGNGLRLADPGSEAAIEGAERGLCPPEAHGGHAQDARGPIGGRLRP